MKLTLILLLFLWDNVEFTLTHEECAELPTVNRAFVLDEFKKTQYQEGDVIYFCCDPGYTTGLNTTYVCTEHGWRAATIGQCIEDTFPVRLGCTRPPALRNGYVLRNTTHVYTDGQKARYQCDHLYVLRGGPHKTCSNGQWIGDLQCLATFCEKPLINNGTLQEEKEKYEQNEVLSYSCRPGYTKVSSEPSVCLKADSAAAAQWSPRPQCEAITCKLSSDPPEGTEYSPQNQIIFRPGQTVTVSCGEKQWVKSNELQSAELRCLDTGRWDDDPVCQMVTCTRNAENVYQWQRSYYGPHTVYIDQTLWYQCYEGFEETSRSLRAKCVRGGWEPNPLCKERGCPKPWYRSAEITDHQKDIYNHSETVHFRCTYDPTVTFYVDCNLGQWRGTTRPCRDKPCTTQPAIEHGEMLDDRKAEYEHGERVQFRCVGETYVFTVTCQQGEWNTPKLCKARSSCTLEDFKQSNLFDENFDLSSLRQSYNSGDNVRVLCKVGTRGFFKLICSNGQWFHRGDKCRGISCGHPGDVQFADFRLVQGSDYVFGSQVQYTCHRGYQMTSFTSTRNCLEGGWDGHLPVCEPVLCQPLTVASRVLVNGDMDQPQSGSVLQFRCAGDDVLEGPTQIICDDYGNWDNKPPTCKEISCPKPQPDNFVVQGQKLVYKKDEVLQYSCNRGYIKTDGRPTLCKKVGQSAQWTPKPQCELITCKLSSDPPAGTEYSPRNQIIFTPGQRVTVSCGEKQWVKNNELQSAELRCLDTGKWDYDPVCQMVTCTRNAENVYDWQRSYYGFQTVYIDQTLWYRCYQGYVETSPTGRAKCVRGGWEPNPLCKERGCPKPSYRNAEITDYYEKERYYPSDRVNFRCTFEPTVTFYVDCYLGEWTGTIRQCRDKPCTTPTIEHGEMLDDRKVEYEHGERVQFRCIGETYAFRVTCQQGKWNTPKLCKDVACTTPPSIANGVIVGQPKPRYRHGETVDFRCTTGSEQTLSVSCQSGEWIPEDQCPEKSACGSTAITDGFSYEHQNKLYYTCNEGFKLPTKGWWGEAACEGGKWKTVDCIASTDCGPVPHIPHMIVSSESQSFSDGDTFPIHCEAEHHNPNLKMLTCTKGKWNSSSVALKDICTPIKKKCSFPPKRQNAVIMAPFEKEYSSGTRLTYKCRDKFTMEGDGTVQCNNGAWEQKEIICKISPEPTETPQSQ